MASPGMWRSPTRLYLDSTRQRVVAEDDPRVGYVLCAAGGEIPVDVAVRYGLVEVEPERVVIRERIGHTLAELMGATRVAVVEASASVVESVESVFTAEPDEPEDEDDEIKSKATPKPADKARGKAEDK